MSNRKQSPLFELINKPDGKSRRSIPLPSWMGRRGSASTQAEAPASAARPSSAAKPAAAPTAHAPAAGGGSVAAGAAGTPASNLRRWMKQPTMLRIPRAGVAALIGGAIVLVGVSFWLGKSLGRATAAQQLAEHVEAVGSLARVQEQPVNAALIPSTVAGVGDVTVGSPTTRDSIHSGGGGGSAGGGDPRQPGVNYYRLTVVPAGSLEEAQRAAAFLSENGVDTALIPINNGRSLKLVALKGFTRPLSDPEAERFEERLKMLGRKWKAQERGSSDWKDMIAEKYRPGVN